MAKRKINFIIVAPLQGTGGSICLHYLCKLLNDSGYNAKVFLNSDSFDCKEKYVNKLSFFFNNLIYIVKFLIKKILYTLFRTQKSYIYKYTAGVYYTPVSNIKIKCFPFFNKNRTIVIYPEVVYGNFLNAKYVVRWFLYYNRYANEPDAFGKNDLFFSYREVFNDDRLNPLRRILYLSYFNLNLYKQTNFGVRNGNCYVIRKGRGRLDLPTTFDGPILDNCSEFEIVKILNECKYCVLYDMQTAYAPIAALCGCIPIQIPEQGKTRKDYCGSDDASYGIAYGKTEDEINWALKTRDKLIERYKQMNINDLKKIDRFISVCMEHFDFKN
jgi:hypothetical protein